MLYHILMYYSIKRFLTANKVIFFTNFCIRQSHHETCLILGLNSRIIENFSLCASYFEVVSPWDSLIQDGLCEQTLTLDLETETLILGIKNFFMLIFRIFIKIFFFNLSLLIRVSPSLGWDNETVNLGRPIRPCNNLDIFFTFWAFFNFDFNRYQLINFQNYIFKIKINKCQKIKILLHVREMDLSTLRLNLRVWSKFLC